MKRIKYILVISLCILGGAKAYAGYNWDEVSNTALRAQMLKYARTLQAEMYGTPVYQILDDFYNEVYGAVSKDEYAWMQQTHRLCNLLEEMYPPVPYYPKEESFYSRIRQGILRMRDYPNHGKIESHFINAYDVNHIGPAKQKMIGYFASPRPKEGEIDCFKVYSSGFIFRTSKHTLGIDIGCITNDETKQSGASLEAIANNIDVFLVTHAHGDHYSPEVVNALLAKGKIVVLPRENMEKINDGAHVWSSGNEAGETFDGIEVKAAMSAQGNEPCLLYHIFMDGFYIAHVGDNSIHGNEVFYQKQEAVDFFIAPIFQGIATLYPNFQKATNVDKRSSTYISAHENELHHGLDGRVSYQWFYRYCLPIGNPPMMMMIDSGESFTYSR